MSSKTARLKKVKKVIDQSLVCRQELQYLLILMQRNTRYPFHENFSDNIAFVLAVVQEVHDGAAEVFLDIVNSMKEKKNPPF